jgi:hypothetical protein
MTVRDPKTLIFDLAERAMIWERHVPQNRKLGPGEFIERLPPDQREILKHLRPEDCQDLPRLFTCHYWDGVPSRVRKRCYSFGGRE